jgi:hypothetical protein
MKESMMTPHFNNGYYQALDDIERWLNSLDSEFMSVRDFRSALYSQILELRPNASRRTTNKA